MSSRSSVPGLRSRIHGCWLGKSVGGTLGLPAEGKKERQHFRFYDPVPVSAPPNDDLELQLVWLHMIEQNGSRLTASHFAKAWLDHIHYMWDEYGRCRWNLRRGVPAESVGVCENWFQSSMGSPIRSEIWACLFPGDETSAARYAALDASLDHGLEGIAGEVFFAAMQNLVLNGAPAPEAVMSATTFLPPATEMAAAIHLVLADWRSGREVWESRERLLRQHGHENFTHAPLNVALTIWALLFGAGDFEESLLLAVNGGYDTDCTAATVGATLGLALGAEKLPRRWTQPIGEGVYIGPGIHGIDAPAHLDELTDRTIALHGRLSRRIQHSLASEERPSFNSSALPGSILLHPLDGSKPVRWANGELPAAVKRAGGAQWEWNFAEAGRRHFIVLAREGATLFLNGKRTVSCPRGLDFVPATHRAPLKSRREIAVPAGKHLVSLRLKSREAAQEASVIQAYPNRHIAPWTEEELPFAATLPSVKST